MLPWPGSIGEQPAYVVAAILCCEEANNSIDSDQAARQADELKRLEARIAEFKRHGT